MTALYQHVSEMDKKALQAYMNVPNLNSTKEDWEKAKKMDLKPKVTVASPRVWYYTRRPP